LGAKARNFGRLRIAPPAIAVLAVKVKLLRGR
jgi:hypothetical protein